MRDNRGVSSRCLRRVRRLPARALVLAAAVSLGGLVLSAAPAVAASAAVASPAPSSAGSASAAAASGSGSGGSPFQQVCGTPAPGYAQCLSLRRTDIRAHRGRYSGTTAPAGYSPADLRSAYGLSGFSPSSGAGQTVAVVDAFDDPSAEADLAVYRAQYGLPPCTAADGCFTKVAQNGTTNYPAVDASGNWEDEESLDLDMVSAICPDCHILLVETLSDAVLNLAAGMKEAVTLGARYVSNSYGTPESAGTPGFDAAAYNQPGVVVTASTGDAGFGVEYPASSSFVTAVGGTTLTRGAAGWSQTAWGDGQSGAQGDGGGSGCSAVEAKPSWQDDAGCPNRTVADVSADADPATGVAVYDTFGPPGTGWGVVGGTSVGSPLVAAVYALAGPPAPGTYPSSYPYADPAALTDVTSGSNGTCSPSYLCTAGPGYDGPTGLGTPSGLAAFAAAPAGVLAGTVTSAGTPVAGATVTAGGAAAVTTSAGRYQLDVPAGTWTVSVSAFGYRAAAVPVTVTAGAAVTRNARLTAVRLVTVRGTVTDGSGQGWALHAAISVAGKPGAPVWTNPATGAFTLQLPAGATTALTVIAGVTGYQTVTRQVTTGSGPVRADISVPVDAASCDAPGYQLDTTTAFSETFDDYAGDGGTTPPPGWTIADNAGQGQVWTFGDKKPNMTAAGGHYAAVDTTLFPAGARPDTSLITPPIDLTADTEPVLQFNTFYNPLGTRTVGVDLSLDGGASWSSVWTAPPTALSLVQVVRLPQAAGQGDVMLRWHFSGGVNWQVDFIFINNRPCDPVTGGLVTGEVTDANTGRGLAGVSVTDGSAAAVSAAGGSFTLFVPATGSQQLTAAGPAGYAPATAAVSLTAGASVPVRLRLTAGRLTVRPAALSARVAAGQNAAETLTVTNTGTAAATFQLTAPAPWLTVSPASVTLQPGQRAAVTVTLTAPAQPGTSAAQLTLTQDTPYPVRAVPVTMTVS